MTAAPEASPEFFARPLLNGGLSCTSWWSCNPPNPPIPTTFPRLLRDQPPPAGHPRLPGLLAWRYSFDVAATQGQTPYFSRSSKPTSLTLRQ